MILWNYGCLCKKIVGNRDDEIFFSAFALVHDCFVAAAERQIHVADAINFRIITKAGIEEKEMPLRRDWLTVLLHIKSNWEINKKSDVCNDFTIE